MASLTAAQRRILEAIADAERDGVRRDELTQVIRRRVLPHVYGDEFREAVASLDGRGLVRAQVTFKAGGYVGRVVIGGITPLGRAAIGRGIVTRRAR